MMSRLAAATLVGLLSACATTPHSSAPSPAAQEAAWRAADAEALSVILDGHWRGSGQRARDAWRHPRETLQFFRIGSRDRVIEISPGAGWYSEILAPYVRSSGSYFAASAKAPADSTGGKRNAALKARFAADPERFDRAQWLEYDAQAPAFGAPGSADAVLTFRNVHNWVAADNAKAYFKAFHDVLKPGGVLGVVDHRAAPGTDLETMKKSGYLTEALVIQLATEAGFRLDARSEINANAKDDTRHPNGVWTLPPTNRHAARDSAKYRAIGESDRMTLRFVKPTGP
ncbi:methyltransferase domain-containing protein [Lysobacter pythonis]|uniref:Methyltransferase domain-containing protein n=1 Tax=Solilutibacter pythonis TaxID=2483112 RepID=A0A3M2I607_9GAMM|nr:methyltransferase domain-containing protein [Lysobacter pythonis]